MSTTKVKYLMVCLGNICRSPTAEAVLKAVAERREIDIEVDSCGLGGSSGNWYKENGFSFHLGDSADSRMTAAAKKRGIHLTSRSRPLNKKDLEIFDYVVVMDDENVSDARTAAKYWGDKYAQLLEQKMSKLTDYLSDKYPDQDCVPDPYYGGSKGFELVLDLVEDACEGLLNQTFKE